MKISESDSFGIFGILAATTQSASFGVAGTVLGMLGAPTIKDIVSKGKALPQEVAATKQTPVGILSRNLKP